MRKAIGPHDSFQTYLNSVRQIPVLAIEDEQALAQRYRDTGDEEAGRALVVHNLRFVVRVAYQYRGYRMRMIDLIQEGNLGLMKAVERFDPDRGNRLITYAVWWIRAYIQSFILRAWSMVRFGTTRAQRRLMFGLTKARQAIAKFSDGTAEDEQRLIAERLHTTPHEVADTLRRISQRDASLDATVDPDDPMPMVSRLPSAEPSPEASLAQETLRQAVADRVAELVPELDDRERYILEHRLMAHEPMLLREIAERYGVSRERIRQVESKLKRKLQPRLADLAEAADLVEAAA